MPVNARAAACGALSALRTRGARPDMVLKSSGLEGRNMALAVNIVNGVLQNYRLLDWRLERCSGRKADSLSPEVRDILRLTAYQLGFLDRVPAHAAVSEGVELAKSRAPRAAGFVNAVLRRLSAAPKLMPTRDMANVVESLGILYSHPNWLVRELIETYGVEECENILAADNSPAPLTAQVNTLKTTPAELISAFSRQGIEAAPHLLGENMLVLTGAGALESIPEFSDGHLYIQDPAARLAVDCIGLAPGMNVLDLCAAPGGKSFAAALNIKNTGSIRSFDIHENKLGLIRRGAERLGINIITACAGDARRFLPELEGSADAVIADVPCSGLGVIRRKPEIRLKPPEELLRLPDIQLDILKNASRYVAPGGALLYSTCTILPRENEEVVGRFLSEHEDFAPEPFTLPEPLGDFPGMAVMLPGRADTDGFFICLMRRKK